jgi:hypothetical protein
MQDSDITPLDNTEVERRTHPFNMNIHLEGVFLGDLLQVLRGGESETSSETNLKMPFDTLLRGATMGEIDGRDLLMPIVKKR